MTKPIAPEIERLKFKELTIDNLYSGRTQKEINENAKEKAKELAAAGGWSPAMPGQYFIGEDGKKVLLAGFSRVQGSVINGETEGYFVKVDGEIIDHLLACETSNSVRPISALAKGARYDMLRNGEPAEGIETPDPKDKTHWKRPPMTNAEIAERIGKTDAWVSKCISIYNAPTDVRELLENDKIAVPVAEGARSIAEKHYKGSEAKQTAICRRAVSFAKDEGKETATKKHFDAIKAEFIPAKKLVADGAEDAKGDDNKPATPSKSSSKGNSAESTKELPEELPGGDNDKEAETLFQQQSAEVLEEGSKKNKKLKEALATFLTDDAALEKLDITMTLNPDEAERLAEELVKIVVNAATVF